MSQSFGRTSMSYTNNLTSVSVSVACGSLDLCGIFADNFHFKMEKATFVNLDLFKPVV